MDAETSLPTCYRHADRETRLSCSHCERPICVDCVKNAAVGQRCPECAGAGRQRVISAQELRAGSSAGNPMTMAILATCVGLYLLTFLVPDLRQVVYEFGVQENSRVAAGQWWRLGTAAFLHAPFNFTHILFNMWALYVLGPHLERLVGSAAFATLYVASAFAGGALFFLTVPDGAAVGASGAIFGLFGAWLVAAYRSRHTVAGRASFRQMLTLLGINLALPLFVPGIAWQAHLGGLAAGAFVAIVWLSPALRGPRRQPARAAVGAVVAIGALALVMV